MECFGDPELFRQRSRWVTFVTPKRTLRGIKTVTIRDFRTRPKQFREALEREREAVLTANGRPVALMIPSMRVDRPDPGDPAPRARSRGAPGDPPGEPAPRPRPDVVDQDRRHHREDPQGAIAHRRGVRVVLDTNVLVAGLLSAAGPPGWIVEAVFAASWSLPSTRRSGRSTRSPAAAEFRFPTTLVEDLLAALDQTGFVVAATGTWPEPLPDPDDAAFLAVAAASASVLITGNLRHFPIRSRRDVVVLTLREFVEHLKLGKPRVDVS